MLQVQCPTCRGLKTTKTSKKEYLQHDTKLSIFLLRHKINTRFEVNLKNYFFISIEYDSHIPLNGSYAINKVSLQDSEILITHPKIYLKSFRTKGMIAPCVKMSSAKQ